MKRIDAGGMEIVDESAQHQAALDLMMALHEAGFTKLWLDSVRMFTGGGRMGNSDTPQVQHYHLAIIVDDATIHHEAMTKLNEIASAHGAHVSLDEVRMNQQQFSRIRVWPKAANDARA